MTLAGKTLFISGGSRGIGLAIAMRAARDGANVALTVLVVIALGALIIYLAQRHGARKDMTSSGMYSLKPATVRLVENLPQKFKVVGLFTKAKGEQERRVADASDTPEVRYQQVADLLQEYQQKSGGRITAEMIDPVTEPGKVDQLFNEVAQKYSNDVTKYKEVLDAYRDGGSPDRAGFDALQQRLTDLGIETEMATDREEGGNGVDHRAHHEEEEEEETR